MSQPVPCIYYNITKTSKYLFNSLEGHLNRQEIFEQKIPNEKWEKLLYTLETENFSINYSLVCMIGQRWLYGDLVLPLPKWKLSASNTDGLQEIWNLPSH